MSEERFADVTTNELLDELSNRCECYVLGCVLKGDQRKANHDCVSVWYDGGLLRAIGLIKHLDAYTTQQMNEGVDAGE